MLSCENLVLSHLSPTINGLSREILFQIACVAHELSMKFVVRFKFKLHVLPTGYELSREIFFSKLHTESMSNEHSYEILVLVAFVAHEL